MPPKPKQPPRVTNKYVGDKKGSRPEGDRLQDSARLRRDGFLQPAPLRTGVELDSSQKVFDFGTAKKPSVESEGSIEQTRRTRRLASNDLDDPVFSKPNSTDNGPIPSENRRKSLERPFTVDGRRLTSTPAKKKVSSQGIPDPCLSTISGSKGGKEADGHEQILSDSNQPRSLNIGTEVQNPQSSTGNLSGRVRNQFRSNQTQANAGKESNFRENYTQDLDFSKEIKWGMDPLQAVVLLQKCLACGKAGWCKCKKSNEYHPDNFEKNKEKFRKRVQQLEKSKKLQDKLYFDHRKKVQEASNKSNENVTEQATDSTTDEEDEV